jgi:hypothetical protein
LLRSVRGLPPPGTPEHRYFLEGYREGYDEGYY